VDEPLDLVRDDRALLLTVESAESFESFVLQHGERLHGALFVLTKDGYEAEEIAQEAFVRVLDRWDRVRLLDDPAGYLYRTAMNVFRNRRRRATLALRRVVGIAPRTDVAELVETHDLLERAIASLPVDQRAALVVTSLLGYSSEEAGRILGIRPSTVRARATRARAALRETIGAER
jgi:RNA polymerase sigma-70 factor (ECF subfamily)